MKFKNIFYFFIVVFVSFIHRNECYCQDFSADSLSTIKQDVSNSGDSTKYMLKNPTGAMVRSIFVPGWGQWYNNKKFKAFVMFSGETALLVNSIYLNQKLVQSVTSDEREFYINNRNLSTWCLVGSILFSMADAFVDAHLSDFDESPDLSHLIINPFQQHQCYGIQLSLSFAF